MLAITQGMVCSMSLSNLKLNTDTLYRVSISNGNNNAIVVCVGMECVDSGDVGCYDSVDDLPDWMQGKIALLMISKEISGVGWRSDEDTFWLSKEKG